jgi:thiamine biosynthesis lipoprotein ApbE
MFSNPFKQEDPALEAAIANALADLKRDESSDETYAKTVNQLVKLYGLKPKRMTIDPNTLIIVAANIIIGYRVLKFERDGIVMTKVWSFLTKTPNS